jgi:hypothetical protein
VLDLPEVDQLPDAVVAVPAYVLDGRLVYLGNPGLPEISDLISSELGERSTEHGAPEA